VVKLYGDNDWANENNKIDTRSMLGLDNYNIIDDCGHFSFLEKPKEVAKVISN
jgi:pimeloyl-ACP methyl ester carboxylesterase